MNKQNRIIKERKFIRTNKIRTLSLTDVGDLLVCISWKFYLLSFKPLNKMDFFEEREKKES